MREVRRTSEASIVFESSSHSTLLRNGLNWLRNKSLLLDVTLIAGKDAFNVHRVVLASCSDYFRAMFTDDMKECQQNVIILNDVSADGMRALIEYAYTSRVTLSLTNIQNVLSAASHLQFLDVIEACSSYLQEQMNIDNCVDVATIAETYSLPSLTKKVYRFMSSNLFQFSQTLEFQRLSCFQLEYLFASDFPVDCSEGDVLAIALNWIHFALNERIHFAVNILKQIHFKEVNSDQLKQHEISLKSVLSLLSLQNSSFCRKIFLRNNKCQRVNEVSSSVLLNTRGMELAIIKVGGFNGISGVTNEISYYLPSINKWKYLTSVPHVEQCNFGVAVLDNELFVIGGCFNQSLEENVHPFGFKYNPLTNSWSTIAPMRQERCRFSLAVVDNCIYAIAGAGEVDVGEGSLCEVYDPVHDSWTPSAAIVGGYRTQHSAVSWRNYIYVCGGLDHDLVLDSFVRYDCLNGVWEYKSPMLTSRADHNIHCYNDKLYVCGGWYEDETTGMRVLVDTIDCYSIETNEWSVVTKIPTPRFHAGSVVYGTWLYIIGGFHSDNTFDRCTSVIECYDIEGDRWCSVQDYPQDIWEHVCSTLYVPRCRDDLEVIADK